MIEELNCENLRLQFDLFHCQNLHGRVTDHLRALYPITGHYQISGVPGRFEPDRGELNYRYLFEQIDKLGYSGAIGCEYKPEHITEAGLGWIERLGGGLLTR